MNELLSFDELASMAAGFVALGVVKIRLTGGEPLLRPGLPELVGRLRGDHPHVDLALTTNALRLSQQAAALREAGLDRVNISLDALNPKVAERMTGRKHDPQCVIEAAEAARKLGLGVKLNAVIKRGVNDSEILPLANMAIERGLTLRFIEYMDVGASNGWRREDVVTGAEIRKQLTALDDVEPLPVRRYGEVARRYQFVNSGVEVGFIESVSAPFCGDCTRARVSAVGELYTCLFGNRGIDLKPLLASGEPLTPALADIWKRRHDRYSELRREQPHGLASDDAPEEMWRLGG